MFRGKFGGSPPDLPGSPLAVPGEIKILIKRLGLSRRQAGKNDARVTRERATPFKLILLSVY